MGSFPQRCPLSVGSPPSSTRGVGGDKSVTFRSSFRADPQSLQPCGPFQPVVLLAGEWPHAGRHLPGCAQCLEQVHLQFTGGHRCRVSLKEEAGAGTQGERRAGPDTSQREELCGTARGPRVPLPDLSPMYLVPCVVLLHRQRGTGTRRPLALWASSWTRRSH